MKTITFEKSLKKKIIKKTNIFYITGNNFINKKICINNIKKIINFKNKNLNTLNIVLDNKYNFNQINNNLINYNLITKKQLIIVNIIEKIKDFEKKIKTFILNINNNNYYSIFNLEFLFNIKKQKLINKNSIIIICNKSYKPKKNNKNIYNINNEFKKNINKSFFTKNYLTFLIKQFLFNLKIKNIKNTIFYLRQLKKNNFNTLFLLNLIFNSLHKNININKNIILYNKIFNILKKIDIKIKKNNKTTKIWIIIEKIIIYTTNLT